jgi:hypothetical protein
MSDQETVLARYPQAKATAVRPPSGAGSSAPKPHDYWTVASAGAPGSHELGRGASESAAWADAARRLLNDPATIEETPAGELGLPARTDQPAPDVKGGDGTALPPGGWPEGD